MPIALWFLFSPVRYIALLPSVRGLCLISYPLLVIIAAKEMIFGGRLTIHKLGWGRCFPTCPSREARVFWQAMVCFDAHGLPAMCARGDELFQIAAKEE